MIPIKDKTPLQLTKGAVKNLTQTFLKMRNPSEISDPNAEVRDRYVDVFVCLFSYFER